AMIVAMEAARSEIAGKAEILSRQLAAALSADQVDATLVARLKADIAAAEGQIKVFNDRIDEAKGKLGDTAKAGSEAFEQLGAAADKAADAGHNVGQQTAS